METSYFEEVEKYVDSLKEKVEREKREIAESQKKISSLACAFIQKAPSNSILNSLFKEDEPEGFVFSKYEEKRKQLGEQRRAEYNAYLEKKEAERQSKRKIHVAENRSVSPKSILDSVDYEQVLAKRKEEEAKFRNLNIADILHNSQPILNDSFRKSDSSRVTGLNYNPDAARNGVELSNSNFHPSSRSLEDKINPPPVEKKSIESLSNLDIQTFEEKIARYLQEQKRQMLLDYENELKKDVKMKEEIQNLKSSSSVVSLPQRTETIYDEFPKMGRTGGGGEPVRDSYGNLITMRGQRNGNSASNNSVILLPSMQQQPIKDRMALYREELQKQIEEKKRLEALEKAKAQELEAKLAQRMEEQRLRMLEEYENELKKTNKINEKFLRDQENARRLEEFRQRDAEAKRKRMPEVKPAEPAKTPPPIVTERSNSPPIPAVRTKALLEKAPPVVPPVTAPKVEKKPENVFSGIAEIRKRLKEEQQKPKNSVKSYEVMNRRTVQDISDDDDEDFFRSSISSSQRLFDST